MTAMKVAIDLFIDANILLVISFVLWRGLHALIQFTALKQDHCFQARLLKCVLLLTLLSPGLGLLATQGSALIAPGTPTTLSDIAVAVYLSGSIPIPAVQFESLLNTRGSALDALLGGYMTWTLVLLLGLGGGAIALFTKLALSALRVRRSLQTSYLWRRTAKVDIRLSDTVTVPFAARGIRRRHVVLPTALLTSPRDLRLVLAHEFQHLRAGDVEWELALETLRPLMFWNPAFSLWKRAFDQLRELSCDQKVIETRRVSPHDYAACLLAFCERHVQSPSDRMMNVAFVSAATPSPRKLFERRILSLYALPTFRETGKLLIGVILAFGICIGSFAATVRQPGDWSHDRLMLSTIVNLERLDAITKARAIAFQSGGAFPTTFVAQ